MLWCSSCVCQEIYWPPNSISLSLSRSPSFSLTLLLFPPLSLSLTLLLSLSPSVSPLSLAPPPPSLSRSLPLLSMYMVVGWLFSVICQHWRVWGLLCAHPFLHQPVLTAHLRWQKTNTTNAQMMERGLEDQADWWKAPLFIVLPNCSWKYVPLTYWMPACFSAPPGESVFRGGMELRDSCCAGSSLVVGLKVLFPSGPQQLSMCWPLSDFLRIFTPDYDL